MIVKDYSLNVPDTKKKRVIIVGGGFAGINIAKMLNRKAFQMVMFDQFNHHIFQPLLYQVATASLEPDSVAEPMRKIFDEDESFYFRMQKISRIDLDKKEVITPAGNLTYDKLIICTGSKTNYFGNDNLKEKSFSLKNVPNAMAMRNQIFKQFELAALAKNEEDKDQLTNFVIVGAGPTGVELAGALAELKNHVLPKDYKDIDFSRMNITLIEGMDNVLPMMSGVSGKKAHKYLTKMGVDVRLGLLTKDYDGINVYLDNDEVMKAKTLIWAAGIKGNVVDGFPDESLIKSKYIVNKFNQVKKSEDSDEVYEDVFAVGDVAIMKTKELPSGHPALAQVAIQQGKSLARNLNRSETESEKWKTFRYTDKGTLATIGRNKAVADFAKNIHVGGFIGWALWALVHLFFLIGFRNKMVVFGNWVWNYFKYDKGVRLIIETNQKESKKQLTEKPILETEENY